MRRGTSFKKFPSGANFIRMDYAASLRGFVEMSRPLELPESAQNVEERLRQLLLKDAQGRGLQLLESILYPLFCSDLSQK